MKKFTAALVLLLAASAVGPNASAAVLEQQPKKEHPLKCDIRATNVEGVKALTTCFAHKFHYDPAVPICIEGHESGWTTTDDSPRFYGVLQYLWGTFESHWQQVADWFRLRSGQEPSPLNPRAAIGAGVYWMAHYGTSPWTTDRFCT